MSGFDNDRAVGQQQEGGKGGLNRRTHSVHHTRDEAVQAAHDLGRLMNGVPAGYVFAVQQKMGKWAFVSLRADGVMFA